MTDESPWDEIKDFERHPSLNAEMKTAGKSVIAEFQDDGVVISEEQMKETYARKGIRIKPQKTWVFTVKVGDEMREYWLNANNFSLLRELAKIRIENGKTLVGCRIKITREAVGNPNESNWGFKKA